MTYSDRLVLSTRLGLCAGLMLALGACGGGSSGAGIATSNPNFFSGSVSEATMTGSFNPAGYSAAQVQGLVSQVCADGGLAGFGTAPREDGLTGFSASCATWRDNARAVEFERTGPQSVMIEITGSSSGNMTYSRIEAQG